MKPYKNLHARMDDIEECVNNRLRKLLVPDFARFIAKFKQTPRSIIEVKKQPLLSEFDPALVVSDKEEDIVDLMGRPFKDKGKQEDESDDKRSERKKRCRYETPK